jgi:Ca2+-transporting ATPase
MMDSEHHPQGLTESEVRERRALYGENRLPQEKGLTAWAILLNQLKSPLIYIILVAALVSLLLRETNDFLIIMVVVVADVILGFVQEYQAQKSYVALKNLIQPQTTVIRDGRQADVEVWELVPGDLVVLNTGDKIPADGILMEATRLAADESILTGENEPVVKKAAASELVQAALSDAAGNIDAPVAAFMGTTVVSGRGLLLVTATGLQTELGKIAASLSYQAEPETPFQIRIRGFSRVLTRLVAVFTILILAVGLWMKIPFFEMLRLSIILAIAAVPEGLLIAVTIILVMGMRRILKRKGLVKRLLAVETLGSVTVICTDKTGTLTEGQMRVCRTDFTDETLALQTLIHCNNLNGPVEIAIWQFASQQLSQDPQERAQKATRLAEEPFTSEAKYMITEVAGEEWGSQRILFLKGAPEIVLAMCQSTPAEKDRILSLINSWADEGLRLLGLAAKSDGSLNDRQGYRWAGLIGMEDPIRDDVLESIEATRKAGIQVKMLTGDYRRTAQTIASRIGLLTENSAVLEGKEIETLSDRELAERMRDTAVFARIRPQDKLRIIQALDANGEVTAMIGDGVNDAPALKRASIGVVVGTAADVAKETADLILTDNRFSTIVAAIEEGRIIFTNVRKVIAYMLSNSFAEVLTIFMSLIFKWPAPLVVSQILWIHLICDGPADIVLGFEPKEDGIMEEKPKPLSEPILTPLAAILIGIISVTSCIFSLLIFNHYYGIHQNIAEGRSLVFASLSLNSMIYIFAYRSMRLPIWRMNRLSANPPLIGSVLLGILTLAAAFLIPALRRILGLVVLSAREWALIVAFALLLLLIVEIGKLIAGRLQKPIHS